MYGQQVRLSALPKTPGMSTSVSIYTCVCACLQMNDIIAPQPGSLYTNVNDQHYGSQALLLQAGHVARGVGCGDPC